MQFMAGFLKTTPGSEHSPVQCNVTQVRLRRSQQLANGLSQCLKGKYNHPLASGLD